MKDRGEGECWLRIRRLQLQPRPLPPSRRQFSHHGPNHDRFVQRADSARYGASISPCHGGKCVERRPRSSNGTTSDCERLRTIREWARDNGYPELGNRGRIAQHIVDEYEAAHGG